MIFFNMSGVNSKRNRPKFSDAGFLYVFDKLSADGSIRFWRCERKSEDCPARLHTGVDDQNVLRRMHEHNHDPNPVHIEAEAAMTSARKRARETQELPSQIINHSSQSLSTAAMGHLPARDAMRQVIQRQRRAVNHAPPAPTSSADLIIPEEYQTYNGT